MSAQVTDLLVIGGRSNVTDQSASQ